MFGQGDVVFIIYSSKVVRYLLVCWSQIAIGTKSVQCNVQSPNLENSIELDRKVTKFWFNKRPLIVQLSDLYLHGFCFCSFELAFNTEPRDRTISNPVFSYGVVCNNLIQKITSITHFVLEIFPLNVFF